MIKTISIFLLVTALLSCKSEQVDKFKVENSKDHLNITLPKEYRDQLDLPEEQQPLNQKLLARIDNASDKYVIKTGFYFGECLEYCKYEYLITSAGIKTTKEAWNIRTDLPKLLPIVKLEYSDSIKYVNLVSAIDKILKKSENIRKGCPDCRDQGGEWFKISNEQITLDIVCEPGQEIKKYAEVVELIRDINSEK